MHESKGSDCVRRVARLEKQIRVDFEELPPLVQELKHQVDNFRNKLETTEHLSWLGECLSTSAQKHMTLLLSLACSQ
jgi:hypothetical protein